MANNELKQKVIRTLEERFKSVKASSEVEGFVITEELEKLILAEARGEITFKEMVEKAKIIGLKNQKL